VLLCSCHRVSDRDVAQTVASGARRVGHVVRTTRAGTDCAGCLPALRELCESFFAERDPGGMLQPTG
jgi:bacterioferritin-associated ferredoxin